MTSPLSLVDDAFCRSDLLGSLRVWQREATLEYFRVPRRDFLLNATPGAGKTAYALTLAAELLARREVLAITVVTPTEHLKHQWGAPAHRGPPDVGHLRRDPPRRRRPVLGRRGAGGVRTGPAAHRPDRHPVPQRHQPDPVRQLRRAPGRVPAQFFGLRVRLRQRARGRGRP